MGVRLVSTVNPHSLYFTGVSTGRDVGISVVIDHYHRAFVIGDDQRLVACVVELHVHADHMPPALLAHRHLCDVCLEGTCVETTRPAIRTRALLSHHHLLLTLRTRRKLLHLLHTLLHLLHALLHLWLCRQLLLVLLHLSLLHLALLLYLSLLLLLLVGS